MILIASLLVLSLSIAFYLQQESIMHACADIGIPPACYPNNSIAFSIFGFIIVMILLGAAYHVATSKSSIANRWALIAMVTSLLAYEVTEFSYITNVITPYYSTTGSLSQFLIIAGYFGTLFAFLGGALGLSIRTKRRSAKPKKQASKGAWKRKR